MGTAAVKFSREKNKALKYLLLIKAFRLEKFPSCSAYSPLMSAK